MLNKMRIHLILTIIYQMIISNINNSVEGKDCDQSDDNCYACSEFDAKFVKKVSDMRRSDKQYGMCGSPQSPDVSFINAIQTNQFKYVLKFVSMCNFNAGNLSDISIPLDAVSHAFKLDEKTQFAVVAYVEKKSGVAESVVIEIDDGIESKYDLNLTFKTERPKTADKRISDRYYTDNTINMKITKDSKNYQLNSSYVVFCSQRTKNNEYRQKDCKPVFEGYNIHCNCNSDKKKRIKSYLVFIIIGFFWTFMLVWFLVSKSNEQRPPPPEVNQQWILCSPKNARHKYEIIFRVGCPSVNFDLQNSLIDIEMIGPEDQPIGTFVRFAANRLNDPVIAEMVYLMGRMTPIPKIEAIKARHSGRQHSDIYFYETIVRENVKSNEMKDIQTITINDFIKSYDIVFKDENKREGQTSYYPDFPLPKLSNVEIQIIVFFITSIIGTVCLFIQTNESIMTSILSIVISSIAGLSMQTIFIYLYKYQIKKNEYEEKYIEGHEVNKWTTIRYITLGVAVVFIFIFTSIIAYHGLSRTWGEATLWLSSTVCSAAIVFSVWFVCDAIPRESKHESSMPAEEDKEWTSETSTLSLHSGGSDSDHSNQMSTLRTQSPTGSQSLFPMDSQLSTIGNVAELNLTKKSTKQTGSQINEPSSMK